MKIAYCLNSISILGGTERVTIHKANALSSIEGNSVFILVTDHKQGNLGTSLLNNVTLINLNVNYYDDDWQKGWRARISQIRKKAKHKTALQTALNEINPDVVIAVGQSEKFFLRRGFLNNSKAIYVRELHFATDYRALLAKNVKEKFIGQIQNFIDFRIMCHSYDAVVCLTPQDLEKNWHERKNAYFIPNPLTVSFPPEITHTNSKKIISVGRLSYPKNYDSLIRAFAHIAANFSDWTLEIYGSGSEQNHLQDLIENLHLSGRVKLMGHTNDVSSKLDSAAFFVLSSIMEGFSLVILEAMSHGLPVVSYDCPFGPSYIIDNGQSGILVPLSDEKQLATSMEHLIRNEDARHKMSIEARMRAQEFLPEKIAAQWMSLFKYLISNRK